MDRTLSLLRANPGLLACLGIALIALVLTGVFAALMIRAGLSLRPLVFFVVFLAIILVPQLVYQGLRAAHLVPELAWSGGSIQPSATENEDALRATGGRFAAPERVFGPGFDPQLRGDVRGLFLAPAPEIAERVVFPNAESAMVARFESPAAAAAGARYFATAIGGRLPDQPEAYGSFTLRRPADWVRLRVAGRTLFIWSSADEAGLRGRMAASAGAWSVRDVTPAAGPSRAATSAALALLGVVLLAATGWFFKGSTWAGSIAPDRGSRFAASADELRERLLHVGSAGTPFSIEPGPKADELVVTWRLRGAWLDLARARGVRRVHKLVLKLDAPSRTVRVREYAAAFDASVDAGGASLAWKAQWGMTFFEIERTHSIGAVVGTVDGRATVGAVTEIDFDLQELKAPLIQATTGAGWTWKPVLLDPPPGLRWLLE